MAGKSLLERHDQRMKAAARIGDNRKQSRLFHKTTIIRGRINEMIQDINEASVKAIRDLIRWKKLFKAKLNHNPPAIYLDIADSLVEPYVCNCQQKRK